MRWRQLVTFGLTLLVSGCHGFGGLRLTAIATATDKPSNVASVVSVTQKGQPVSELGVAAFHISENDQPLDSQAIDLRLLDPSTVAAFHTVLLLDLGHGTTDRHRRQLSRAAAAFVRRVRKKQSVTVLAFDGAPRARLVTDFALDPNAAGPEFLENLMLMAPRDSSRNLRGALISALDTLDIKLGQSIRPLRVGTVVVFSRGPDIAGRVAEPDFDKRLYDSKYQFLYVTVAGDPTNDRTDALASRGKVEAQNADTLPIAFEEAGILANKLSSQYYLLSYCSPGRAGERRLRIEVQLNDADGISETDAIETRFDATGFSPNCNSAIPPRFSTAPRAIIDRAASGAGAPRAATTAMPPAVPEPDLSDSPTPPLTEEPSGGSVGESEAEVPPPKKPGYAP